MARVEYQIRIGGENHKFLQILVLVSFIEYLISGHYLQIFQIQTNGFNDELYYIEIYDEFMAIKRNSIFNFHLAIEWQWR